MREIKTIKNLILIISLIVIGVISTAFISSNDDGRNGTYRTYYKNGNLKEEATYRNDRLEGMYRFYYTKGREEDAYKVYFENGNIKEEGN